MNCQGSAIHLVLAATPIAEEYRNHAQISASEHTSATAAYHILSIILKLQQLQRPVHDGVDLSNGYIVRGGKKVSIQDSKDSQQNHTIRIVHSVIILRRF